MSSASPKFALHVSARCGAKAPTTTAAARNHDARVSLSCFLMPIVADDERDQSFGLARWCEGEGAHCSTKRRIVTKDHAKPAVSQEENVTLRIAILLLVRLYTATIHDDGDAAKGGLPQVPARANDLRFDRYDRGGRTLARSQGGALQPPD